MSHIAALSEDELEVFQEATDDVRQARPWRVPGRRPAHRPVRIENGHHIRDAVLVDGQHLVALAEAGAQHQLGFGAKVEVAGRSEVFGQSGSSGSRIGGGGGGGGG